MTFLFLVSEAGMSFLFALCLLHSLKYNKKLISFLLFAVLYAVIFENANMILAGDQVGGYYYNNQFHFFIFGLPLFVPLAWSSMLYASLLLSQSLPIKKYSIPFVASLLVLLIDLSIDAVSIRLNFWSWIGYGLSEGWFGVPANNFLGWLLVSFTFYFFMDMLWKNKFGKQSTLKYFFATVVSYLVFYSVFLFIVFIENSLKLSKNQQFYILAAVLVVFILNIKFDKNRGEKLKKETSLLIHLVRWSFYIFCLVVILVNKIYAEAPLLLLFSVLFMIIEILIIRYGTNKK